MASRANAQDKTAANARAARITNGNRIAARKHILDFMTVLDSFT
jgi:hypothetical protein